MPVLDGGFSLSQYRWLVFDAVGTLIQPNPSVAVAYHSIASQYGSRLNVAEIGARFGKAFHQSEVESFPGGPARELPWLSSDAIEVARWNWIVDEVVPDVRDRRECFIELWDHFAMPSSWSCFSDVLPSLTRFRSAGLQLAIASNFDSRLHSVCDGHQDLSAIQQRFVSSEVGVRKPAPEFYEAIVRHCHCPANEILMIGDDPDHDVAGPIAAGLDALLINRKAESPIGNSIRSLSELI